VSPLVFPVAVFIAVGGGIVLLGFALDALRQRASRRSLAHRLETFEEAFVAAGAGAGVLVKEDGGLGPLGRLVPRAADLGPLLEQADLRWTGEKFLLLSAGCALGLGLFAGIVGGSPLLGAAGAAGGLFLPLLHAKRVRAKRLKRFEALLPEAIDLMGRALRAGHPFIAGLKLVADESAPPVSAEFRRVFEEQRFGVPVPDALLGLSDRVPLLDVRIFITAVMIQREVGGNLAEILDKLSYTIRERFKIKREIQTRTAQGRMTGMMLGALPFGVGGVLMLLNPAYFTVMFTEPSGKLLIAGALLLQVIGYLWVQKVVNIDV
jgi:tight adherence protein B